MTGPEEFAKLFAGAFGRQDTAALTGFLAEDADVLTLTGAVLETAAEAEAAFAGEFAGIFAAARLVTGKHRLRMLGPGACVVTGGQPDLLSRRPIGRGRHRGRLG